MNSKSKILLILLVILGSFIFSASTFYLPKVQSSDASETVFSAERALKHVEVIAKDIHPLDTPEIEEVRKYLLSELSKLGLKYETQKAFSTNILWGKERSGNIENIYAVIEGTDSSKAVLLMAHYDSTEFGPGAADDAAGVAAILETVRILRASEPLKNDIIILLTDGEEEGMLGARAFVDHIPLMDDIGLVINLEARGNRGPAIMFETSDNNGWYMKEFKKAVPQPVAYSFAYDVYRYMPNETDYTIFRQAGKSGFNIAPIAGFEVYHTEEDTVENLNVRTLQHMGSYALALTQHFGNLDLRDRETKNAVYFTAANSIFIVYSEVLVIPLATLACCLFIFTFILGIKHKRISLKGSAAGTLIAIIVTATSAILGFAARMLFKAVHVGNKRYFSVSEFRTLIATGSIYLTAILVVICVLVIFLYTRINSKVSRANVLQGTALIWIIISVIISLAFKSASYIFIWPTIFLLLGMLLQLIIKAQHLITLVSFIAFLLVSLTCIVIFAPLNYLFYQALITQAIPILSGVSSLPIIIITLTAVSFFNTNSNIRASAVQSL